MPFSKLGLSDKVLAAVTAAGYTTPTPIQEQAIPHVLARRDVLGIAQTGTGKTAAFTLPMLTMLENGRARARMPRTLILEPTRELAAQVEESFDKYGAKQKLNVALIIGGVSFDDQDTKLTRGVDVLIATPGRLLDHFERGRLLLTGVELLVIDEADRMLDMGFIPDIERICKLVPFTRQTLFFTATMPPEIRRITEQFLHNPVQGRGVEAGHHGRQHHPASGQDRPRAARQARHAAPPDPLRPTTSRTPSCSATASARSRSCTARWCATASTPRRCTATWTSRRAPPRSTQFRKGEVTLLIASDVAARGLDIPDVSHVFNFDVPHHADDYVHRIGRTGRAGKTGTAITIVAPGRQQVGRRDREADRPEHPVDGRAPRRPRGASQPAPRTSRERSEPRQRRRSPPRQAVAGTARTQPRREHATRRRSRGSRRRASRAAGPPPSRARAPKPAVADDDAGSHLPAFLLRPVRVKA